MSPDLHLRITDAEREAASSALAQHYSVGRLSRQEYDDRSDLVWSALTYADLQPLFTDLPEPHGPGRPARPARSAGPEGRRSRPGVRVPVPVIVFAVLVLLMVATRGLFLPVLLIGWLSFRAMFGRGHFLGGGHMHRRGW